MSFYNLSHLPQKEIIPGYRVRFVHTNNLTLAYWEIDAGAALPEHKHPHEQIANVTSGEFELTVSDKIRRLTPGQIAIIPPNTPHSGKALTNCQIIDVFYPVREDYLDK
ncbi:MAG: cupin [Candidatus Jacksonbacteria bacterium RIFOXYC2_FULL_44_29]|nr:MAG: putative pectin degradation protein [Parcubacteria group bacterium GW2011_GWC2_44_22]OGY75990.1 MAG: cupin [Candidatus Jacksonbacteria bacterium RIFOXYA2_FULL_43_12]OGY76757.1 MAG: cupin [Candidatus Jacksonbacteria bacterium RIFOXYB2_FULL_44_15]OGY79163.1 MAG: cupin [Candidatus Jacksonbacteria bacterium RIFOXYC2_FULL_44_29]OGY82118.1 MAG: cupin [Candidatus Jacksonbacteria bacterium RIFOXYD2_FULL_43_21]HBH46333.1 cupin domain-containing protein [Candidatus Jacksonbacteria bacterium]